MEQFEALWAYQAEDMKADSIANDIKRSPTRIKLEKTRDFIMERQKKHKKIEEEIGEMLDRKDIISEAIARSSEQLAALEEKFGTTPPENESETAAFISEVVKCRETLSQYEAELRRMVKETNTHDQQLRSLRLEAARAKQTFDQLKVEYDAEAKLKKQELDEQRKKLRDAGDGIDEALLNEYNTIKKHITPPIARLQYGQCSGCNTAQPSAILSRIRGGQLVECETCGRIIIQ